MWCAQNPQLCPVLSKLAAAMLGWCEQTQDRVAERIGVHDGA
jgi:hypothetical protein